MSKPRTPGPLVVDPGTVFGFRTAPMFEDSPPDTGRYGALVVLAHDADIVALGVLEGVWTLMPTLDEVRDRPLLRCNRFFFKNSLAVFACNVDDMPALAEFAAIGLVLLTVEQTRLAEKYMGEDRTGRTYGFVDGASSDVEGEWRWAHDREALEHEYELREQRRERERAAAEERYETRLKGLTWERLLSESPFARWDPSPPFPPAEFRDAAAARVHEACRELQALGAKPRKAAARKALKELMLWLNDADDRAGGVIETEEREDIHLVLEEIAHVARHPSLMEEVGLWRDW